MIVADSLESLASHLNIHIASLARQAIAARGAFTVALSGGSLPSFLSTLEKAFGVDAAAHWDKWHILLADERCVPESDDDSNLKSLRDKFLSAVPGIPESHIHGIDPSKLDESTDAVAVDYEKVVKETLQSYSGGCLDLAVLGFGPDGHTCSLFPNHALLNETERWVAPITDSPKPPPNRITLTFPVLNQYTRHVIVCGAGGSKGPILEKVVKVALEDKTSTKENEAHKYQIQIQRDPAPFPCAMVDPTVSSENEPPSLTWIVDADAMKTAVVTFTSSM